jgi:hypothetical protein
MRREHKYAVPWPRFAQRQSGNLSLTMLRKVTWTALYGVIAAAATLAARRAASRIWRIATGEEPPAKK